MILWYDVSFQTNLISKNMQKEESDLITVLGLLIKCKHFLENYRKTRYEDAAATVKEISDNLGIEAKFKEQRQREKKIHFIYEGPDQVEALSDPETHFKGNVFYPVINNALTAIDERFSQLQTHTNDWDILYDIRNLPDSATQKPNAFTLKKFFDTQILMKLM